MFIRPRCLLFLLSVSQFTRLLQTVNSNEITTGIHQNFSPTDPPIPQEDSPTDDPSTGNQNHQDILPTDPQTMDQTHQNLTPTSPGLNTTTQSVDSESILYDISEKIFLYASPIITIVGLFGNTLIFAVVQAGNIRRSPVSVFMSALSCADSIVLVLDFINNWVELEFGVNFPDDMDWFCKAYRFLFNVVYTYSAWLVSAVAIERFVAVWFPFQAKQYCTVKTSKIVVSILPLIIGLLNTHNIFMWHRRGGRCDIHPDFLDYQSQYDPWINAVLYSWMPVIILIFCNSAIIIQLSRSQKNRKSMGAEGFAMFRVTLTVIVVCISFTLLTVPLTLFYIILFAKKMFNSPSPSMALGEVLILILGLSNHAINFFLYNLTLPQFYRETSRLLCRCGHEDKDQSADNSFGTNVSSVSGSATVLELQTSEKCQN